MLKTKPKIPNPKIIDHVSIFLDISKYQFNLFNCPQSKIIAIPAIDTPIIEGIKVKTFVENKTINTKNSSIEPIIDI